MVKLQKDGNGRYHITLPKKLIEGFGWQKGDEIDFEITGRGKLKIAREDK